jgi:hypothetical protein
MSSVLEKGKPVARRGRKATGLQEVAGLPKGDDDDRHTPLRLPIE